MTDNNEINVNEELTEEINDNTEIKVRRKEKKENNAFGVWFKVVVALLVLCIIYSAIQTAYIYRLNVGLEGLTTYLDRGEDKLAGKEAEEAEDMSADKEDLPEPWFSLEEAASVSDPNKQTLTTVEIVDKVSPATLAIHLMGKSSGSKDVEIGAGTGFIITEDGYIVTNRHVIEFALTDPETYYVTVTLPNEEVVEAAIVGTDIQTDIAVLKVDYSEDLPCVTLGSSDLLQTGELVVAIGNALGTLDDTVTVGVVSALDRENKKDGYTIDVIQTDAAINNGNSGGPLINSFGEVIGITNAKMVASTSEGLGFAIPIDTVKDIIEDIINYGKVIDRPFLGVSVVKIEEGAYYGVQPGVYAAEMVIGGPADHAGIEIGDLILSMGGVEINETDDIIDVRDQHDVGDTLEVVVVRDGEQITLYLEIGDSGDYEGAEYVGQTGN
jgi:serine protease Do